MVGVVSLTATIFGALNLIFCSPAQALFLCTDAIARACLCTSMPTLTFALFSAHLAPPLSEAFSNRGSSKISP